MDEINFAYSHLLKELGLDNVKSSLTAEFDTLRKAHDSIHEFLLLGPLSFPDDQSDDSIWHGKSAFFIYQHEAFRLAHRSLLEALCGYYNAAFILLRSSVEMVLKGAFWQCLSQAYFRDNAQILRRDRSGKKILQGLTEICRRDLSAADRVEEISARIFDEIRDPKFRPSITIIVKQLEGWKILKPIQEAKAYVYDSLYGRLSAYIHVVPDRTDIGRKVLVNHPDIFEEQIQPEPLREYAETLHQVMDVAVVVELNILEDLRERYAEVAIKLNERLPELEKLGLVWSLKRARQLEV